MMNISIIENSYESLFHPLHEINDDDLWVEREIVYGRCSAFPFRMKTYEELLENIDNSKMSEKEHIINRFYSLITMLSEDYSVYLSYKRSSNTIIYLKEVSRECVDDLVQNSRANLFVPELQIICIGHDDFGFILLSAESNDKLSIVSQMISNNLLYLLRVT